MKCLCPICPDTLLRHLKQRQLLWFCPSCRQEMPNLSLLKVKTIPDKIFQPDDEVSPVSWDTTELSSRGKAKEAAISAN